MKVLVTGSTGAIGQWVVKRLLEDGHSLRALDVNAQPPNPDYEHIPGDVRDLFTLRRAAQGMEAVVHLAAIPFDMERQDAQILETNILGTANVLLAAQEAGVRRVVYFSSINALGQAEPTHPGLYLPLDDAVPHHNVRNYSLSKHIGEEMCAAFARRGVFSAVSLRPTMVTQPDPEGRRWWEILPEEFLLESHISDLFSYVDVRDVADATALSLTAEINGHQAFLLAFDEVRTRNPTAEIVEKHFARLPWPKISKEAYLSRGEFVGLLDCSAAKQVLGWQPKYNRFDPASGY